MNQVNRISEIAKIEPHAVYSFFTHGLKHRYTFLMRTIPSIDKHLQRLDDAINNFITIHLRGHHFTELERDLIALLAKLIGLGIIIPSKISNSQYQNSRMITEQLTNDVKNQQHVSTIDQKHIQKLNQCNKNKKAEMNKVQFNLIMKMLAPEKQKHLEANNEVGASNWLSALPIKEQGFYLDKQTFRDALYHSTMLAIKMRLWRQFHYRPCSVVCQRRIYIDET